jgi:DNA-binding NarL/FixJ family response regulator
MPLSPCNIGIVDANLLFRRVLENYLSVQKDIHVIMHASDVSELFKKLDKYQADILVIDSFVPGFDSSEVIADIQRQRPQIKIIVLAEAIYQIGGLLDSGVNAFISKSDEPEELLLAIQTVSANRLFRNKLLTEALYWRRQNFFRPGQDRPDSVLNEREKKILRLLWEEKSVKEIADELFIGTRTVERIRQEMKEKTGAKSTIGLMRYAIHNKIITEKLLKDPY